jgi:hypothetical protein
MLLAQTQRQRARSGALPRSFLSSADRRTRRGTAPKIPPCSDAAALRASGLKGPKSVNKQGMLKATIAPYR